MARRDSGSGNIHRAFDAAHFGSQNILNLRESLPTASEAAARAESWLRLKQVEGVPEVLIVTGRGNNSPGGVSMVREAVVRVMLSLRRRGVVDRYEEHTPGSFAISLAPLRDMVDAPRRRREIPRPVPPAADITGLDEATRQLLHDLAERSLEALGIKDTSAFLEQEMRRQYSAIVQALGNVPDRELRLKAAIKTALDRTP
jgi:hypothetical protein